MGGLGNIANAAHLGGLAVGVIWALGDIALFKGARGPGEMAVIWPFGGGTGVVLRWWLSGLAASPWGTMGVNILGSAMPPHASRGGLQDPGSSRWARV